MSDVRPRSLAIGAAVVAFAYLIVLFGVRPVPEPALRVFGAPSPGIERAGGLRLAYRPPGAREPVEAAYPGVTEDQTDELIELVRGGGLEMHEVAESDLFARMDVDRERGVRLEIDQWRPEEGGPRHSVPYLLGVDRAAIQRTVERAAARGVAPGPDRRIAFERVEPWSGDRVQVPMWRTYEIEAAVAVDGGDIASATTSYDPNTNRPVVLIDFTRDGGRKFGDVTSRIVGRKLATMLGGRVRSAPIINGAIRGGRASVTMGGNDPMKQEHEARMLVGALAAPAMPAGGTVEHAAWMPPADMALVTWLGRAAVALLGALVFGALAAVLVRFTRPRWRAPFPAAGAFPVRRLLVTLLAPVVFFLGLQVTATGINDEELMHVIYKGGGHHLDVVQFAIIGLGLVPVLGAFSLVELAAIAVPPWRRLRHDPRGRGRLGLATAVIAIGLALVQGYFIASYMHEMSRGGLEILTPGWHGTLGLMASYAGGTFLLAILAGVISEHGLGNGYGAVIAGGWLVRALFTFGDEVLARIGDRGEVSPLPLTALVTCLTVGAITGCVLRWRIGEPGKPALRVPSSGIAPVDDAAGLGVVLALSSGIGLVALASHLVEWTAALRAHPIAVAAVLAPAWSWLFARPRVLAPFAARAGLAPPDRATWLRAAVVSEALILAVTAIGSSTAGLLDFAADIAVPVTAMLVTAVALDIFDDAHARRIRLAPVWVLHQVQRAGVVEHELAAAGIPCHLHASSLRTLLAFFGPFAPVIVMVPAAQADDARAVLAKLAEP